MGENCSPERREILSEVQRVLDEPYEQAKKTHIWAEEVRGEHNWLAMTNFRDALDHMSKIFQHLDAGEFDAARENLGEMEAHVQRAAFDSAQSATEQKLVAAYDERLPESVYKMALLDHMGDDEYDDREDRVADRMSKGRNSKATSLEESIKHFRTAYEHARLMERGTPTRKAVVLNLAVVFGVILSTISVSLALLSVVAPSV